jgi:hypothetical protein
MPEISVAGNTAENTVSKGSATASVKPSKSARRGIDNTTRGTIRLKFDTRDAKQNGLFLGHLASVEVKDINISEESTGMPSFNGLSIPKLTFTFASNDEDAAKRKYVTLSFNAVESNAETIPGGKSEWKVNQIFDYVKHILNVFVLKGRELTPDEEAALLLAFEDFDEDGNYVPVEPETVISAWRSLFENVASILNTARDGQPAFKTKDGKAIALWLKLVRYIKNKKKGWTAVSNGDLAFPTFVGEGAIELFKQNIPAGIRVDIIREDIKPRQDADGAKAPNLPNAIGAPGYAGGVGIGGPIVGDLGVGGAGLGLEAAEDLPF